MEALHKVADGGTVVDPEVVRQLLRRRRDPLEQLTPRPTGKTHRRVLAVLTYLRACP